jgi:hypothetical protein
MLFRPATPTLSELHQNPKPIDSSSLLLSVVSECGATGRKPTNKKGKKRKRISSLPKHRILNETYNCPLRNAIYHPPLQLPSQPEDPPMFFKLCELGFCHTFRTPHSLHAYMLHSHTWFSTTSLLIKTTTTKNLTAAATAELPPPKTAQQQQQHHHHHQQHSSNSTSQQKQQHAPKELQ